MANNSTGGSYWDRLLLSDEERKRNDELRAAAERGEISWDDAHAYVEGTRAQHGYSGGKHGDQYIKLDAAPEMPDNYGEGYRDAVKRYTEMAPFSYDHRSDPAWQAYKKQYAREGRRASEDTLGRYAAMTGGMPSTAAVTAAQQAGDYYNAQMTDRIPELYELAYAMYTGDAERLYRQMTALQGARDDELARYQTALRQWNAERDRADALDQQAWERAYRETAYADSRADRAADEAYRERAHDDDRADRAADEAYRERAHDDDRADRAADEAYRERAHDDDRADRAADEAYRERSFEADRADRAADEAYRERAYGDSRADRAADEAYRERAYVDSRADKEAAAAKSGGGRSAGGGSDAAAAADAPAELPVDYDSVLDLGYGPISAERLSALIAAGEVEQYEQGGKLRFRRVEPTQAPAVPRFTDRFRERFG